MMFAAWMAVMSGATEGAAGQENPLQSIKSRILDGGHSLKYPRQNWEEEQKAHVQSSCH